MNKLLQHLIDSGDVSHKVLPSLMKFQLRGEVPAGLKPIPRSGGDMMSGMKKPVIQMTAEEAKKRQLQMMAQKAVANQATVTSPLMTALPASREATIERNRQYAAATGKSFNPATGAVSPLLSDNTDRMMRRAQENIVNPMFEIEMALSGAGLVGQGLKAAGKYVVNNAALKNASKSVFPTFGQGNSNSGLGNFLMSRGIEINPVGIAADHSFGLVKGAVEQSKNLLGKLGVLKNPPASRSFFETFPVTKAQRAKVMTMQDEALADAKKFTDDYWYGNSLDVRPVLEEKMRNILPEFKMAKYDNNLERGNSPFGTVPDRLVRNTTWGKGREGLSEDMINYLNNNRGRIGGVNNDEASITLRNSGLYYKTPREIANTVAHESGHSAQNFGVRGEFDTSPYIISDYSKKTWGEQLAKFDPEYNYYTSNPDTEIGRRFQEALVSPKKSLFSNGMTKQTWRSSPNEVHSELMASKYNMYKQGLRQGYTPEQMMERVTNPGQKELEWLLDNKTINKHFKKGTSKEEKLALLKLLPAAVPAVAGASMLDEKAEGGEVSDYKGTSIVDYLATRGYSGKKAFRKELASKYGVENYDYSAAKNTELLNRMRENDDLLETFKQNAAPVSAESLEQMYRANLEAKKQENYNNIRRRMALDMGYDPLSGQSQFEQAQYPELSLIPKNPNGKNSLVNGLQGTGKQPQPAPAPVTQRPANWQYVQPGKPSTQTNFEQFPAYPQKPVSLVSGPGNFQQFPGYPEQAAKAPAAQPAAAPDWRYVQPGKAVPQNPFQQFPAYPTRQVADLPKKTTAKAAAKALEEDVDEQNWFEEAASAVGDGVEYVSGLFNGLQRKWDSTQKEDPRSIKKVNIPTTINKVLPGKTTGSKKDSASAIPYGYKQLYAVADSKNPKDSLVSFVNIFDNDEGGRYYIGHKAKEVTDAGAQSSFDNVEGVAHFLRDSDILPGQKITPESWEVSKGYTYHTTSPGKTVSAAGLDDPNKYMMLYRPNPKNDGTYLAKYVKNKDITPERQAQLKKEGWQQDFTVNAQHKFTDIAWDKDGPSTGYAAASKWLPLKDGKHTYIPYKSKDGFSRFSGGSGVYLFKDPKTGKKLGADASGSVNTIRKIGEDLIKTFGIKPEDLELAYHDMGSYSAKPKAHNGKLDYNQWLNYNTYNRGFSGAPMMIPKKNNGGPIVDPRGQWAHPGKRTMVPTPTGQITMQGVPYPVYGQDETGYGQMMMPGGEYSFPGQMVDETPMMQRGGTLPAYQIRGQVQRAATDNTRVAPKIDQFEIMKRVGKKTVKDQFNQALQFQEAWMESPMYKKMIQTSDPKNADAITARREEGLSYATARFNPFQLGNNTTGGFAQGTAITVNPAGLGTIGTLAHEVSHAADSWNDDFDGSRAIPNSDVNRINFYKTKNLKEYKKKQGKGFDQEWYDYVTEPTETRARLNTIRQGSHLNKLYDPLTQKVTPEIYKKLKDFRFEPTEAIGFDPLLQLRGVYSDQQIIDLLNSVSKNNSQAGMDQARYGGGLLSRSVSCFSCGHSWKSVDGGSDPLHCHKCGGMIKMQNGGNLPAYQMRGQVSDQMAEASTNMWGYPIEPNFVEAYPKSKKQSATKKQTVRQQPSVAPVKQTTDSRNEFSQLDWQRKLAQETAKLDNPLSIFQLMKKGYSKEMAEKVIRDFENPTTVGPASTTTPKGLNKRLYEQNRRGEILNSILKKADVATDIMQLGHFLPIPSAQISALYGDVLGSGVDAFQAGMEARKGNYGNAVMNVASLAIPYQLGKKGYTRDMANTEAGSLADKIAGFGNRSGDYRHLTPLNRLKNNPVIKKGVNYNRGILGALGAETVYDSKQNGGEMIRRADGSYSQRGLWDNIRANKGSGKKPTKQMLEQERKIKKAQLGLWNTNKTSWVDSIHNVRRGDLDFVNRYFDPSAGSIPTPRDVEGWKPGQTSTHLMADDPGSRRVYPQVVNVNGKLQYMPGDQGWNYADDTKQFIEFPTAQQAAWYANNGYKLGTGVLKSTPKGKQPLEKKHNIKVNYK